MTVARVSELAPATAPCYSVQFGLVIPYLSMLCGTSSRPGRRTRVPAASSTLSNSPIVRDVLDNGLRILTERMTQVRSVSIGVWLTRGSRHETRRARRHRALRRAHAVQGHGDPLGRGHRPGDRLDRRPARRVHREGIRELLHQGARRAPAAGASTSSPTSCCNPGVQPRRHRAREEGRRRRDQDGRGHARRPRPRALHAGVLGEPSARPADSRHHARRSSRSTPTCCATTSATPTRRAT